MHGIIHKCLLMFYIVGLSHFVTIATTGRSRQTRDDAVKINTSRQHDDSLVCPTNDDTTVFERDFVAQIALVIDKSGEVVHDATSKLEDAIELQEEKLVKPLFEAFVALLLFKPPVGFVMIICLLRLIGKGRIFRRYPAPKNSLDMALERRKRAVKQSYTIDRDDVQYHLHGGIVHVRLMLCSAAIVSVRNEDELVLAIIQALAVSMHPDGGRLQLVRDLNHAMSKVETGMSGNLCHDDATRLLTNVYLSLRIHQMDALLRLCRDQVITAAYRLAGTKEYWERRVRSSWRVLFGNETIVGDRARLAFAQASYQAEIERLGRVVSLLRKRPKDFPVSLLLDAFKQTKLLAGKADSTRSGRRLGREPESIMAKIGHMYSHLRGFDISTYSFRWQGDGRGLFSLKSFDKTKIPEQVASTLLIENSSAEWLIESESWLLECKRCIIGVIREALNGSTSAPVDEKEFFDEKVQKTWISKTPATEAVEIEYAWNVAIDTVIGLSMWRRAGEGRLLTPRDSAIVLGFRRRFDFYGLPSTCFFIWLAYCFHLWAMPRWERWFSIFSAIAQNFFRILDRRVRRPFVGLYKEIMNENQSVTAGFGLKREEVSLDHMLFDLGFGNGRPSTRKIALQGATTAYELALRSGVIRGLVSGRLIRLLLIQVQQLKVGVLSAVGRIDVLLKGNQINFRILAAVPALVASFYIIRLLWRSLYNIRSRDLRPVTAAHQDMATFLIKVERLLLSNNEDGLGEMTLYLHRYLLLLDFSTPPYSKKLSDEIMESLYELSEIDDRSSQATLLHRTQEIHQQMVDYL